MRAGFRLRQIRERLGLTFRDVEAKPVRVGVARGHAAHSGSVAWLSLRTITFSQPPQAYTLATIDISTP